ncbi:hypothetical protein [Kribbella pittospori]|uniref:hypothetical protein n=1 Tax=Kribbella pittospori TaxID=722689 RepID=UPI001EDF0FC1|nr:hypothetical protein [Kribbella pittospori]
MYELIPVAQAPQYDEEAEQRFAEEWPEFIFHDLEVRKYIDRRQEYFPEWEFYLVSDDERLIAGCWGVPLVWDGPSRVFLVGSRILWCARFSGTRRASYRTPSC